jgi:Ca2+-binding EF-hand superfamily protein
MEVFESDSNICIIMEHCSGGDLSQRRFETENDVCSVVFQLAEAVAHCHHLGIVHRDLKMENIMFVCKDSDSIRLIDFGLSKKFLSKDEILHNDKLLAQNDKCRIMKTACGTAFYMAPEMLTMSYSEKADIWALGVITYMLITGRPPFEGRDENTVFERVRRGRVVYNEKVWCRLSLEALQFTKALLTFDPEKRPSAKETLELPWLANYQKRRRAVMDGKDGKLFGKEVCDSLIRFASYPPLKRAALMVVSHHVKERDTRELRNMFLTLDEDHSGELTFEEMFNMIRKYSVTPISEDYFRNVFDQMDHEKTGKVHYMEFLAATLESRVKISGQLLNQAFDHLDVESNGIISIENMQQLLGRNFTRADVEGLIKEGLHHCHCGEHDAIVTRADFIQMMGDAQLPSPSPTPTVPDTPTPSMSGGEHAGTPTSLSRSETPSTNASADSPAAVPIIRAPPPIVVQESVSTVPGVIAPTGGVVTLNGGSKPSLRGPKLSAVTEETGVSSLPDSRAQSPFEAAPRKPYVAPTAADIAAVVAAATAAPHAVVSVVASGGPATAASYLTEPLKQ